MADAIDAKAHEWFTAGCASLDSHPADLLSAISSFTRAIFLCPDAGVLWYHRGESYFRLCDFHAAMVNFRRAHALDSAPNIRIRLSQLHFILGRLALDSGDIPSAVRSFTAALDLQPDNTDFWIFRIKAWIRGKSYGKALAELNEFITHPAAAEYLQNGANNPAALTAAQREENRVRRERRRHQRDQERAKHAAEDGIDTSHIDEPQSDDDAGDDEPAQADSAPLDLDSSPAPALLTARGRATALSLWRTVQALILRAKLHVLLSRSDLALRDAGWAIHLAPSNPEVVALLETLSQKAEFLYGTAVAHVLAGEKDAAIVELSKALELNPHQVKFYSMRSRLLRDSHRYDDALKDIKMALSISESMRAARRAKREAEMAAQATENNNSESQNGGATFVTAPNDEEEEKTPEQAELENSLALTFNGLGVQYFQSCHFSHALSCFSKCLDLSPHCASFYVNRGDAYLEVGEEDHALSDYQMARKLQTNGVTTTAAAAAGGAGVRGVATKIAEIHAKRGKELFNRVDYESALSEFSRAVVADPGSSSNYFLRARVHELLGKYELAYSDVERAVWIEPAHQEARKLLLALRATLLRPKDQARAEPLPQMPRKDKPWLPNLNRRTSHNNNGNNNIHTNGNSILALLYNDPHTRTTGPIIQHKQKRNGRK